MALARLHQGGLAAAALGGDHRAAQLLTDGHRTAQGLQVALAADISNHEAEGLITVDQVVEDHLGAATHLGAGPAGGIEKGIAAVRALETIQPSRRRTASHQHKPSQEHRKKAGQQGRQHLAEEGHQIAPNNASPHSAGCPSAGEQKHP